jgi:L-fuculose-phosphate aldolase
MLETICDIMTDAYKRNWITSRDGNVSIRHHDRDHFYITPSGVRKQTLQPDQFKKISIDRLPLHFGLQREMGQHAGEVRVVVHVHPTYCIAAMHAGIDLSTVSAAFPELNRYTKVAPNVGDVPPISQELADQCHKNLQLDDYGNIAYDILGIKGHGVVAIDTSPWRAYEHIERLEHICKIVLASGKY